VIAMACGFPPTITVAISDRELGSMTDTVPDV
jgi:hypothetical protein